MIDPAELVFAYSSRITGASRSSGTRPSTPLAISWFIFRLAWCSQNRRTAPGSRPSARQVVADVGGHHRAHLLEHLLAALAEDQLVRIAFADLARG